MDWGELRAQGAVPYPPLFDIPCYVGFLHVFGQSRGLFQSRSWVRQINLGWEWRNGFWVRHDRLSLPESRLVISCGLQTQPNPSSFPVSIAGSPMAPIKHSFEPMLMLHILFHVYSPDDSLGDYVHNWPAASGQSFSLARHSCDWTIVL